jgi:hypothetical protein
MSGLDALGAELEAFREASGAAVHVLRMAS